MDAVTLVNGLQETGVSPFDRGLAYGDGVFETIALRQGQVQLWSQHCQRLTKGLLTLGLSQNQQDAQHLIEQLRLDVVAAAGLYSHEHGVIKLTITRGVGGRGYLAPQSPIHTRIVNVGPWPMGREDLPKTGIHARLCNHPWSNNAALAGLKHLNRLDQVLARNEWQQGNIHEGIMRNQQGHVISGVMSNLFIEQDGILIQPLLDDCGIHGVMAQQVCVVAKQLSIPVQQKIIPLDQLLQADAVFLTNSLNGIWPLVSLDASEQNLGQHQWGVTAMTKRLQKTLNQSLSNQPLVTNLC